MKPICIKHCEGLLVEVWRLQNWGAVSMKTSLQEPKMTEIYSVRNFDAKQVLGCKKNSWTTVGFCYTHVHSIYFMMLFQIQLKLTFGYWQFCRRSVCSINWTKRTICWYMVVACPECFETRFNKNSAPANRSRVSCAHNTLIALIGLNITPRPWNLG